jgi:hypothetical protein
MSLRGSKTTETISYFSEKRNIVKLYFEKNTFNLKIVIYFEPGERKKAFRLLIGLAYE